jgi:hypothetical protein
MKAASSLLEPISPNRPAKMTSNGPILLLTISPSGTVPRIVNDLMSSVIVVPLQSTGV